MSFSGLILGTLLHFTLDNAPMLQVHGIQEDHRIICEALGIDYGWYQGVTAEQHSPPWTTPEDKQRCEQEQAHQRELEQARALVDVQTRAASWLKVIAGVIGVLLLITISLTIYAFDAKNKATQQARLATSHQLVAHARSPSMRLDLALLSSLAASHIIDTVATRGSILDGLLRSPRLLSFLAGHTNTIASVTFSPDGKTLASGSWDKIIVLWDVSFGSWKDRACRIANHNLTPEEWKQYIGDIEPYRAMCPGLPIVMEAVSKSKVTVQP